jgi:general secretion pathway protein D
MYNGSSPSVAYAGSSSGGGTRPSPALSFNTAADFPSPLGSGLSYYLTLFDFNVDMALYAAKNDSNTEINSTPVVMTQDNKEATIKSTSQIYVYKGKRYVGDVNGSPIYEDDVERQDVGLTLTVTPRINANGFVVMTIEQSVENVSGQQVVNGSDWPIITRREVGADIAIQNGETIVLGGLVQTEKNTVTKQVPFLGSIPILGWLFKTRSESTTRNEMVIFLTPYVLDTPDALTREAVRRRNSLSATGWDKSGWSNSKLISKADAEDPAEEEKEEDYHNYNKIKQGCKTLPTLK